LSSWWWAEKPPETLRALTAIKNIVLRCILWITISIYCTLHSLKRASWDIREIDQKAAQKQYYGKTYFIVLLEALLLEKIQ
jgi:uncharacterized SAM-binding protein YcdF (DUF218 family)